MKCFTVLLKETLSVRVKDKSWNSSEVLQLKRDPNTSVFK